MIFFMVWSSHMVCWLHALVPRAQSEVGRVPYIKCVIAKSAFLAVCVRSLFKWFVCIVSIFRACCFSLHIFFREVMLHICPKMCLVRTSIWHHCTFHASYGRILPRENCSWYGMACAMLPLSGQVIVCKIKVWW